MTRAEEVASMAYPVVWKRRPYDGIVRSTGDYEDINLTRRIGFQQGYERAERDLGWHPASEHPPIDEEVIVLTDALGVAPYYEIAIGHIVNIDCVDFNGWNIRGVVWWMPMPKIPNEDE